MNTSSTVLPTFGLIQIEEDPIGERGPAACLGHNDLERLDDLTPTELRQLAADALAAAEWLEERQVPTADWSKVVRETFAECGFTVEGLPDTMTESQADSFLWECIRKLKEASR